MGATLRTSAAVQASCSGKSWKVFRIGSGEPGPVATGVLRCSSRMSASAQPLARASCGRWSIGFPVWWPAWLIGWFCVSELSATLLPCFTSCAASPRVFFPRQKRIVLPNRRHEGHGGMQAPPRVSGCNGAMARRRVMSTGSSSSSAKCMAAPISSFCGCGLLRPAQSEVWGGPFIPRTAGAIF
ncbi:hypothetical protein D3C81_1464050 [compost metagenome]